MSAPDSPLPGSDVLLNVTAWHEAGHALAAMREGRPLRHVVIEHDRPGFGQTRYDPDTWQQRYCPKKSHGNARAAWEEALANHLSRLRITLAGPLAEARKLGQPMRALGAWYDFEDTYWLAQSLMTVQLDLRKHGVYFVPNVPSLFNLECRRVRHWLARPVTWSAINRIAQALIEQGELSARDVLQCYLQARNPAQHSLTLDWPTEADDERASPETWRDAA